MSCAVVTLYRKKGDCGALRRLSKDRAEELARAQKRGGLSLKRWEGKWGGCGDPLEGTTCDATAPPPASPFTPGPGRSPPPSSTPLPPAPPPPAGDTFRGTPASPVPLPADDVVSPAPSSPAVPLDDSAARRDSWLSFYGADFARAECARGREGKRRGRDANGQDDFGFPAWCESWGYPWGRAAAAEPAPTAPLAVPSVSQSGGGFGGGSGSSYDAPAGYRWSSGDVEPGGSGKGIPWWVLAAAAVGGLALLAGGRAVVRRRAARKEAAA